jgi:hypothetical protein
MSTRIATKVRHEHKVSLESKGVEESMDPAVWAKRKARIQVRSTCVFTLTVCRFPWWQSPNYRNPWATLRFIISGMINGTARMSANSAFNSAPNCANIGTDRRIVSRLRAATRRPIAA